MLAAGSVVAALLAYVFFAVATRSLGAEQAAPISVLWSYWAIAAAVLTFSVQHWTIRTLALDGHGGAIARYLPTLAACAAALAVVAGVVAFVFRYALFGDGGLAFPALAAGVTAGSLFVGLIRGALAGRGRYVAAAASLAVENAVRVAAASGVAMAGAGPTAFGAAMVIGPLGCLVWVRSLSFESVGPAASVRSPMVLVSGVAGGLLIAQVVLSGGPVVLAVTGGAPATVSSLFLTLAIWRAPYVVALGVTPQLTTYLTRLVVDEQWLRLARIRRFIVLGVIGLAGLAALAGATVLPVVLHIVFGPDIQMDDSALAILGIGTATALGNSVMLLLLLAFGRAPVATGCWTAALAVSAVWVGVSSMSPEPRVVIAFLLAQLTAFVLLFVFGRRGRPA